MEIQGYPTENSELNRVSTYASWPSDVSPLPLARSGLSYSGNNDEVVCVVCNTRLRGWRTGDNPRERHRQIAPDCPFLKGTRTGNFALKINSTKDKYAASHVPTTTDNADLEVDRVDPALGNLTKLFRSAFDRANKKGLLFSDSDLQFDRSLPDFDRLRHEEERLRTFHDWPAAAKAAPETLACAGLFYTGSEDRVQCAFCRGFIHNWLSTDIPEDEHKKHFPDCLFISGIEVGNVPLIKSSATAARTPVTANQSDGQNPTSLNLVTESAPTRAPGQLLSLATPTLTGAKYPNYSVPTRRIESFKNRIVPCGQTEERLADAGWFYTGPGDKVMCFQCGGNLKDWEPEDDPWLEHKKWYPDCVYINAHWPRPRTENQPTQPAPQMLRNFSDGAVLAARVYSPEPREVKARMDTPTVRAILDMGYSRDLVKMAIENRLSTAGDDFQSAENLLEALFQLEEVGPLRKTHAFGQNSNYAAETWSTTSGYNSSTSLFSLTSSRGSIASQQPDLVSLPPTPSAYSTDSEASIQSMIPVVSENINASAIVVVATGNVLVAEGLSKAKGKRKRNKKKKQPLTAATGGDDSQSADTALAAEAPNDQENVEADLNIEEMTDEEAIRYQEENRQLREARTCKVCMDSEVNTVFLPCGHLVCCCNCAPHLRNCPICRTFIRGTVKTFLS